MRLRWLAGIGCAGLLALVAGCGGDEGAAQDPGPAPLSARPLGGGVVPRVKDADFKRPIERYRVHVGRELAAMQPDVAQLIIASSGGDLAAARRAWLAAYSRYQTIGAAYGAFGDLDGAIDGGPGGLEGGTRSPDFTGLHRIELALWGRGSTAEAAPYARQLASDVARLRTKLPRVEIEPLDYALRSHEVLEDTLHLQLSDVASRWAGAALVALRSNVEGTEVVLRTLRPLISRRNPQRLAEVDRSLARLRAAIRWLEGQDGVLPRWDSLPQRGREQINGLTAAAAEQLAYVPEIVDPLPPRPLQPALGQAATG